MKTKALLVRRLGGEGCAVENEWMLMAKRPLGDWRAVRDAMGTPVTFRDYASLSNAEVALRNHAHGTMRRMGWRLDDPREGEERTAATFAWTLIAICALGLVGMLLL